MPVHSFAKSFYPQLLSCAVVCGHSLTCSLIHGLTDSRAHWFMDLLIHGLTDSRSHWFMGSLIHGITDLWAHWFTGSLIHGITDSWAMSHPLNNSMCRPTQSFVHSPDINLFAILSSVAHRFTLIISFVGGSRLEWLSASALEVLSLLASS